jgi:hypothetical protein
MDKHEMDWANYDPFFVVGSMRDPQPDPGVEATRREIYRRFRHDLFLAFAFPTSASRWWRSRSRRARSICTIRLAVRLPGRELH